jgi:2-oxoglutarate dehydrogenase E2 component (dihydrolipoamide succinyltransferase)
MPTDVLMPQMGESIAEGTIVRWIKKVGEKVDRDEPLFEISTDKVDAEIPSPAAGTLSEIKVKEGETVAVNSVVAVIAGAGEKVEVGSAGLKIGAGASTEAKPPGHEEEEAAAEEEEEDDDEEEEEEEDEEDDERDEWSIDDEEAVTAAPPQAAAPSEGQPTAPPVAPPSVAEPAAERVAEPVAQSVAQPVAQPFRAASAAPAAPPAAPAPAETEGSLRRQKSSPLVRKIAREHNVDIAAVPGTGLSGRVTKDDILGFIAQAAESAPAGLKPGGSIEAPGTVTEVPGGSTEAPAGAGLPPSLEASADRHGPGAGDQAGAPAPAPGGAPPAITFKPGERVRIEPMSVMRKKIAEHMVLSARTSPHVYSVYEINFGRVAKLREAKKNAYETQGVKLTFTGFIAKATVDALRAFPIVNASVDGDKIVYKADINLGIAVALDWGLIVPVIKNADEKNLLGISRAIQDLAARARAKKLQPEDVQGGTFTITNPGIFGALYGLPMINQPQVAILGVGAIEKRPVVVNDAIAVRPMAHLSLGYDHRLVDGADAGRFLQYLKERLENFDEAWC